MLHTLAKSLRENRRPAIITILSAALEVIVEILIPTCMASLIDFGINEGSMAAVWRYGLTLLFFALVQLLCGIIAARQAAAASVGFAANLRDDMYQNVQTFAFSNIDKFSAASLVTRLTTDVTNVQNAFQMLIRIAVRSPVMLVASMVASFRIHRDISLTFFAIIPVLAVLLVLIIRRVHPIFRRVFRKYDTLNNVVQENVRGIRVVKSFHQEELEKRKFGAISEEIYRDFSRAERLLALNSPLMQICVYGCMLLISWLGACAVVASGNNPALGLTTGSLTALFTYALQTLMSLMMLSMVFAMITISLSSAQRIAEILEEKTDDIEALRGAVAMVLQKNELFSGTIRENLRWGDERASDDELRHVCRLACADEFISAMPNGYDTMLEQGGANVSGGQKQRLCIARALLKRPKILILDDSTSAVDTRTDALIQKALSDYLPETTKLIIAQRISSVQNADRIVVLENGAIHAAGTHTELLASCAIYREIYESQQKGEDRDAKACAL